MGYIHFFLKLNDYFYKTWFYSLLKQRDRTSKTNGQTRQKNIGLKSMKLVNSDPVYFVREIHLPRDKEATISKVWTYTISF